MAREMNVVAMASDNPQPIRVTPVGTPGSAPQRTGSVAAILSRFPASP